jgi:acetyl esterase/lipase
MLTDTDTPGATEEAPDAVAVHRIWPGDGVPPGAEGWTWSERTIPVPWALDTGRRVCRNVVVPTLTEFRPEPARANGTSLIIAPGGAFHFLMVDHEGYDMARWATALGMTAFVLKYRVMHTPERDEEFPAFRVELQARLREARQRAAPGDTPFTFDARKWSEDDGRQAVRFVREHAREFEVDAGRIGIAGFSAGGAVAMGATLEHDAASRPDFTCAIYPVLPGKVAVPADAPPLFIAISDDDPSVPAAGAAGLYMAWRNAGKPAELHVFGNGGHGWGMATEGILPDPWTDLFESWLRTRGLLDAA